MCLKESSEASTKAGAGPGINRSIPGTLWSLEDLHVITPGRPENKEIHNCWSMDFVSDALFDGKKFRDLAIVDNCSRFCVAIGVGQSLKWSDIVNVLQEISETKGVIPKRIQTDNGSEFQSKEMDRSCEIVVFAAGYQSFKTPRSSNIGRYSNGEEVTYR